VASNSGEEDEAEHAPQDHRHDDRDRDGADGGANQTGLGDALDLQPSLHLLVVNRAEDLVLDTFSSLSLGFQSALC